MFAIFALILVSLTTIALGQDAPVLIEEGSLLGLLNNWPGILKLLAFVAAIQVFLRGLSEALTRIADYTETKWDNKVAAWCSEAAWILGSILGKVGYGTPKLVAQEQIKDAQPKLEVKKS